MRRSIPVAIALFGVFSLAALQLRTVQTASATAANTVNFQARLQTASGAIVPDGFYNVEFKLYSGSSCDPSTGTGCTNEWTEDYLNSASNGLKTINGYLTANLGSVSAFPSTIKWDQKLWLSMNIGGTSTGTVSWDGVMKPYLSLTSVPFAFSAQQLSTTTGSGHSTLSIQGSSSGDQNFVIQDQGAAGTYNLLTTNQANAGYIQLQGSTPGSAQTGNFNISGTGIAGNLQAGTAVITPAIRPLSDSTTALQIQNHAGTTSVVTVDTTNARVGIGMSTAPSATLDVMGATADNSSIALNVKNSAGGVLISARNDGQVSIGTTAAGGTSTTFGSMANTTPDTGGGDSNYFVSSKYTTGANPGTLTSVSIYVNAIDPSAANDKFRLAIYADDGGGKPGTLIAQSAEGTLSPNTFNTLPLSASLTANTTYWLAYQTNGTAIPYNDFSYSAGSAGQYYAYSNPYGPFPSTAGTSGSTGAVALAIYGTYTEAGTSTTPAVVVASNGNVGIGGVTAPSTALQVQGTVAASALSLTGNGSATAFQAGLFDTASGATLNIGTSTATSVNIGNSSLISTVTIGNGSTGGTFINYSSTLNPAAAMNNFTSNGSIGSAASTVDIHTSFTINQTSSNISLTIPSPTVTTAGRIIYIANIGTATTTINSVVMGPGTSASFFWNGSAWISAAVSTGVSVIGTYSSTSIANGASISGNTLTLGVADGTNPGMVSTGTQTFAGAKTFTDATTIAKTSTTAFQIQNTGGGTTLLTADTSSNRIGIGTAAPGSTLDIKGSTSDAAASALNVQNSAGGSVLKVRNDGQVTIGAIASSGTSTTFGNNTHTTADSNDSSNLSASKFTTGGTAGTLTSISIWVNGIDPTAANDKYRLAIYSDAGNDQPDILLAQSAEGTLTANSFNTLTVNASLSANTTYWLAYQTNGSGSTYNNFSYASGTTKQYYYKAQTYGSFPSNGPTGGSNGNVAMAIYGTYTLAGTATTPALTVASNGNVGIGNAAPGYALDLVGSGNFTNSVLTPNLDTAAAGTLTIAGSNATTVNIANNAVAHTLNVATGAAQQTVTIGSSNTSSTTTVQGGNGISLQTNSASAGVTVKSVTNSTSAFRVQNASNTNLINVDTVAGDVSFGVGAPPSPLGYTTVGGTTGSTYNNKINAHKFTATQTGTVSSMSVYVPNPDSSPTNHYQVGIYSDSGGVPSSYIASSASTVLTSGWNTTALTTTPTLSAGTTYWLVYWADVNDTSNSALVGDSGVSGAVYYLATSTYGSGASNGMPTTFPGGSPNAGIQHSIYVTFASTGYAATISGAGNLSVSGAATFTDNNNSTTAFQIQNSSATALFTADTVNNKITIGSSGQFSVDGSGNVNTTGTSTVKSSSTTALQVKNSSNTGIFTVDTTNGQTINNANLNVGSASNTGSAGHLFSDSFESGNTKLWDQGASIGAGSSLAANTTTVHNGKYSMKMIAAGTQSAAKASINGAATTVLRGYVNLTSNTGDLGLMELDSPTDSFQLWIDSSNGNKLAFWDNAAATSYLTSTTLSTGTWHEVEMDLTIGSGTSGAVTVYVDGTSVLTKSGATGINTGTSNPTTVTLGTPTADTGTAYFDDFVVDTVRPGDGASVNVGDSLHVSGTSTFSGSALFQATSSSTAAFQIQNSSGTTLLAANTSTNTVTMGSSAQFSVDSGGNFSTTGTGLVKTTSASAFTVQDASNNVLFNVDTSTGTITFGTGANTVTYTASGGLNANGTAQHTKQILLSAEYAGAVLDATQDSSCSSANNGTLTAAYDGTTNYYKWVSNATAQCYDVVVRVPLPSDFNGWASSTPLTISTYTSNTSTGLVQINAKDTANTTVTGCNYVGATPGSTTTWTTTGSNCNLSTGTYSANGTITLRIRMTGNSSSDVRIDGIALSYKSKF